MRGGLLPAALLCVAYGLAAGVGPRAAVVPGLALLAVAAVAGTVWPLAVSTEVAFAICWASLIVSALTVYLPRGLPYRAALVLAPFAGVAVGAVVNHEARPLDLALTLPLALVCIPARWAVGRGWLTAIRVVSSWLIAIALLSMLLPTAATPGYVPDHMG